MQNVIGIRELRAHLSAYIRRVKAGETVIITDRGRPVGRIVPYGQSLEDRVDALELAGLISWNGQKLPQFEPTVRIQGNRAIADLLLEDRE